MYCFGRRVYIAKSTRMPKTFLVLLILEFPITVAALILFGIASPNLYRTRLWQDGADNGFNSSPNEILYAMANYRPITVPVPWNQFTTTYNMVLPVVSMFVMLTKPVLFFCGALPPILSFVVHAVLIALYAVALRNQAGSDMSDPAHPQPGAPWYLTKSCKVAAHHTNIHYCQQAKAGFAVCVVMIALFLAQLLIAFYSFWPNKNQKATWLQDIEDDEEIKNYQPDIKSYSPDSESSLKGHWPLNDVPKSPIAMSTYATHGTGGQIRLGDDLTNNSYPSSGTTTAQEPRSPSLWKRGLAPVTPRTAAFNILGGARDHETPAKKHGYNREEEAGWGDLGELP
ncbi:MAG: hypothetical protein M1819_005218 [Sarea resinae]|nr:MAG: hypothetical protein M1819_005218 [Sarea resinae]